MRKHAQRYCGLTWLPRNIRISPLFRVHILRIWLNLGWRPDFLRLWIRAFVIAWPVASMAAPLR